MAKLRCDSYFPSFLEPRKMSEQALVAVVQEAYVKDTSTRKIDDLAQAMGITGISKSQVSKLCSELDGQVNDFLSRQISGEWPCMWPDATHLKSRQDHHVVSRALVVAVGVNQEGRGEVLVIACGAAEIEAFWTEFLRSLSARGLGGVRLVISDGHQGLKNAAAKVLAASWQCYRAHFMRNALGHVAKKQHAMVATVIRTAFVQGSAEDAEAHWRETEDRLRERFPHLGTLMDEAEKDVLGFICLPKEHWKQIASTNPIERVNKEIKRRANVVGIFPNNDAILRLIGSLVIVQNEEWHLTRRYMSCESLAKVVKPESAERLLEKQAAA